MIRSTCNLDGKVMSRICQAMQLLRLVILTAFHQTKSPLQTKRWTNIRIRSSVKIGLEFEKYHLKRV